MILDIGLPGLDGLAVLKRWRANGRAMPVLILTARDRWSDKVAGIDAGAMTMSPSRSVEAAARTHPRLDPPRLRPRLFRDYLRSGPARHQGVQGQRGWYNAETDQPRVPAFSYLMHHMGEVVSRTELVEHMYDQDFDRDSNTIEVFVGRLRKKIGVELIETVRGLGYRMVAPEGDSSGKSG